MVSLTHQSEGDDRSSFGQQLSERIALLEDLISRSNQPGHLDGLLAHYILGDKSMGFQWNVDPMTEAWFSDNEHRLSYTPALAVLGYGLAAFSSALSQRARDLLIDRLPHLMRKDPFQLDGVTFVNDPTQVVGIALAVDAIRDQFPHARTWLAGVLQDERLQAPTPLLGIFHQHARQLLGDTVHQNIELRTITDPVDLASVCWLAAVDHHPVTTDVEELREAQNRILNGLVTGRTDQLTAPRAAVLMAAVSRILATSIDQSVVTSSHVGSVLRRFQDAMRRWRYDDGGQDQPIRWPITSEREVQDILWMILRSIFDDVVDEETLRKVGHSSYRADFGIPSLGLLIEVKYARKASDFKVCEKEIFQDYVAYLKENHPYREMIVFIYDESSSVQEHGTTRHALLGLENVTDVIVVSRPSQLPSPAPEPSRPRRSRGSNRSRRPSR
ncbi:PD-(D/E)XK nuclease domain-containing protein [Nonomuraea phyllanthi]|uniref:PD-(D/E)XK nuclease domain-containing protein n=1 Tax=Nonomuraea phyllanthi TaxID=2219224 RepID=UPI0018851E67|nr:hypothetical protein [Nonomuraea phyllanthi]